MRLHLWESRPRGAIMEEVTEEWLGTDQSEKRGKGIPEREFDISRHERQMKR